MTLTEFLLARLAEDSEIPTWAATVRADITSGASTDDFQRVLSLAYADHPDYREEWRP
jgi:hypothetical protein